MATDIGRSPGQIQDFAEISAAPPAILNSGRLYTKDVAGVTELFYTDSAGTETTLTGAGGGAAVTGAGTANYVAYWTAATALTGTAGLQYDGATFTHTPTATIVSGASATANLHTVAAATVTLSGSTSITTALGFNIASIKQATLSAASALTITSAAGLYVEAPIGGGAGPATLTNEHAIWGLSPTAKTATVSDVLRLEHQSSGTPAANFGAGILFRGQDASKTAGGDDMCRVAIYWTTATSGSEASQFSIGLRKAGAVLPTPGTANVEQFVVAATGNTFIQPVGATGVNLTIGSNAAGTTGSNRLAFITAARQANIDFGNTNQMSFNTGGSYAFDNVIFAANGTVSSPSYNFTNDADTGIYLVSTSNIIGVTSGGVLGFQVANPTVTSAAGATLDRVTAPAQTVTISGSTNITTATGLNLFTVGIPTYSNASIAVSLASTLYVAGAPAATGGCSITKAYSLWIDAGLVRLDSTTANSTTACVFTAASGPAGANTAIQEWLTIDINGTTRFIPCW